MGPELGSYRIIDEGQSVYQEKQKGIKVLYSHKIFKSPMSSYVTFRPLSCMAYGRLSVVLRFKHGKQILVHRSNFEMLLNLCCEIQIATRLARVQS